VAKARGRFYSYPLAEANGNIKMAAPISVGFSQRVNRLIQNRL